MNKSLNKVIILGNVGNKSKIFHMKNGIDVINLSIATSQSWKNKTTGQYDTKTIWHKIVIYGKLAQFVENNVQVGSQLYIEGSLQNRNWVDKAGLERNTIEIVVNFFDKIILLDKKNNKKIINNENDENISENLSNNLKNDNIDEEGEDFDFDFDEELES